MPPEVENNMNTKNKQKLVVIGNGMAPGRALEKLIEQAPDAYEITIFNATQYRMGSEGEISREHITNNEAVRKTLLERGIRPEALPAAEDVKKTERRLSAEEKKSLKNPDALDS